MDKSLSEYLERVRPAFSTLQEHAGHQIAFAFLSYKLGIYHDAVTRCDQALKLLEGRDVPGVIATSLRIVRERADALSRSQYDAKLPFLFTKPDLPWGIIDPSAPVVDADLFQLTNALVILYAAALSSSPEDEQALEEQEKYVLQLLATYQKSLKK
jgi:DNA-binding LacI/PurR family transcriptional regulator